MFVCAHKKNSARLVQSLRIYFAQSYGLCALCAYFVKLLNHVKPSWSNIGRNCQKMQKWRGQNSWEFAKVKGTNASRRSVGEPGKPREARACNYAKVSVNRAECCEYRKLSVGCKPREAGACNHKFCTKYLGLSTDYMRNAPQIYTDDFCDFPKEPVFAVFINHGKHRNTRNLPQNGEKRFCAESTFVVCSFSLQKLP